MNTFTDVEESIRIHILGWKIGMFFHFFLEGLSPETHQFLDLNYGGQLYNMELNEALDFFEYMAENAESWNGNLGLNWEGEPVSPNALEDINRFLGLPISVSNLENFYD